MGRRGPLPTRDQPNGVTIIGSPPPPSVPLEAPPSPPGLLAETRRTWTQFWASGVAQFVDRAGHMQRLVRWISDVDRWNRIQRDMRPREATRSEDGSIVELIPGVFDPARPWLGKGSTGQISRHPSSEEIDKLDARIHRAEVEYGMTPYAGVRLGLAGVQGALTAEQLSRLISERARRDPDPGEAEWAEGFTPS